VCVADGVCTCCNVHQDGKPQSVAVDTCPMFCPCPFTLPMPVGRSDHRGWFHHVRFHRWSHSGQGRLRQTSLGGSWGRLRTCSRKIVVHGLTWSGDTWERLPFRVHHAGTTRGTCRLRVQLPGVPVGGSVHAL